MSTDSPTNGAQGALNRLERHRWLLLFLLIPLLSVGLHWRAFHAEFMGPHSWRQAETQAVILNFARQDIPLTQPRTFITRENPEGIKRMEFPIMQWAFSRAHRVFGESVALSRILTLLLHLLAMGGAYLFAATLFRRPWAGLAAAWLFAFTPELFYFAVAPAPDNLALCASMWALAAFAVWVRRAGNGWLWLSAALLGLATLAKLPYVLLYVLPATYLLVREWKERPLRPARLLGASLPFLLSTLPWMVWYLTVMPEWPDNGVKNGIFAATAEQWNDIAHSVLGTLTSILPESLIGYAALPLFLIGLWLSFRKGNTALGWAFRLTGLALVAFWAFELNQIQDAHSYYLFPMSPLILVLSLWGAVWLVRKGRGTLVLVLLGLVPLLTSLRYLHEWDASKPGYNRDLLVYQQELRSVVPAEGRVYAGSDEGGHLILYLIDHKGDHFYNDFYDSGIASMKIERGLDYLYSDNPEVEADLERQGHLGEMLGEFGSIRVYRLKPKE